MTRWGRPFLLVATAAIAIAACGGDVATGRAGAGGGGATAASATTSATTATTAVGPGAAGGAGGSVTGAGGDGGAPSLSQGVTLWAKRFGGTDADSTTAARVPGNGHIALTGLFQGGIDFGGAPLATLGYVDMFVAELDGVASHIASASYATSGGNPFDYVSGGAIAPRPQGGVVIAGLFTGTMDLGGGPLTSAGGYDIFVVAFDGAGNHQWSRRYGDASIQCGPPGWCSAGVSLDSLGDVYLSVTLGGTFDFGGGTLSGAGDSDLFVARLTSTGQHVWSRRIGSVGTDGGSVLVAPDGRIWLAGVFEGTVDVAGVPLAAVASWDGFVAQLDPTGAALWAERVGGPGMEWVTSVAPLPGGDIVLAASFDDTVTIDGVTTITAGAWDVLVAELDPGGALQWSTSFGGTSAQTALGVVRDGNGNLVLGGYFYDTFAVGSLAAPAMGDADAFLVALDATGVPIAARVFGAAGFDVLVPFADAPGAVLVTGVFENTVDFGTGPLTSAGSIDIGLLAWAP